MTFRLNAPHLVSSGDRSINTESNVAGHEVYRATASGGYGSLIATLQGNVTNYVATGLQSGSTYFFVISVYDNAGNESAYSTEVGKSIF